MKYINFKRFKFSTIFKNINFRRYNFLKISKFVNFRKIDFRRFYKYFYYIRRFDFRKFTQYFKPKIYSIRRIKKINFISYKFLLLHLPVAIIFFVLLYLVIPTFYNYDKSNIESVICENKNIECLLRGEVNYSFYPTPRIKIKGLIINDSLDKRNTLLKVEHVTIKLSIKNLLVKEKHKFKKIDLNDFELNLNSAKLKKYKNIFSKKINFIPITFTKGKIIFFDKKNYVATFRDVNCNLKLLQNSTDVILKGKFLDDNIFINLNSKKVDNKVLTDIILKMSDMRFLAKANLINSEKDKDITSGNFLIKKDRNRIAAIFYYKDNELTINKSNLRNPFLEGKLEGKIKFLPYFNFNLDLSLSSINFTKLYNYFLSLEEKNQKNLFKVHEKINGKLSLSSAKIYSKYNLVKSIESRVNFINGNILVDQFLINLGKLGAADILGEINNDKKFTNFKYESNVFIDNQKKFLSKFGIYNKQSISSSLFISGNFDLKNIKSSFYEISNGEKLGADDVNFIEKEFNDFMLSDGYENLFRFQKFKEFIKIITSEAN